MASTPSALFTSDALRFFRGLKRSNTKTWFEAHRDQYHARLVPLVRWLNRALGLAPASRR